MLDIIFFFIHQGSPSDSLDSLMEMNDDEFEELRKRNVDHLNLRDDLIKLLTELQGITEKIANFNSDFANQDSPHSMESKSIIQKNCKLLEEIEKSIKEIEKNFDHNHQILEDRNGFAYSLSSTQIDQVSNQSLKNQAISFLEDSKNFLERIENS